MAPTKPYSNNQSSLREFKHRVLTCLHKLSDRDTHSAASSELEAIARTLTDHTISPFISSITTTDSSDKSLVRKQCVRLISTLSETHGNALATHLSKLMSAVVRRLRDPDTAVRTACVAATGSIAAHVTKPPFTSVVKPLVDALVTEQDLNAQNGAALCLASAVDAAPDPDVVYLRRMLPRMEKLVKCDSFKARAALLTLLGSVIGVGAASSVVVVKSLVNVLVEFVVKSEDWSVRKAAAEGLEKLAVVETDLLVEFKVSCLKMFEAKKFDKVKIVRETMNRMIEAWKAIPDVVEEALTPPESHSSSKAEVDSDGRYPLSVRQITNKRIGPNGSSTTSATQRVSSENNKKTSPAMFRKLDRKKPENQKSSTHPASSSTVNDRRLNSKFARPETERILFDDEIVDEEVQESEYHMNARLSTTAVQRNITVDMDNNRSHKDSEELSLIRNQLVQIETQQANLLDLLQKFIGSSQTGMRSLETRVHGLELTLDEISFDLARSTGRLSHPEPTQTLCCKLPGSDFLTSKLWKKTEIQHANTRISSSPFAATSHLTGKNTNPESCNLENRAFRRTRGGSGLIKNPLAEVHRNNHRVSEI